MKILVFGADGYIGWPLYMHLISHGHNAYGYDNQYRRKIVASVIPLGDRRSIIPFEATDIEQVRYVFESKRPDVVIHLAEQPSAAWSMASHENCIFTHKNNVISTLNILYAMKEFAPNCHLIKLGSMGEYGTPDFHIPETECVKRPGSWYHATKVHDSTNVSFACRNWGLTATDIMQGVVYGVNHWDLSPTRFDIDECFGTVINRFCAQSVVGHPLTIYGEGHQKRSFLCLADSIKCITLLIENPPPVGDYRVVNQFHEIHTIADIAELVSGITGIDCVRIDNPRIEEENHDYSVERKVLDEIGYFPQSNMKEELCHCLDRLHKNRKTLSTKMLPKIKWV